MRFELLFVCILMGTVLLPPASCHAQLPPLEAVRSGPHPATVANGELLVYARGFTAVGHNHNVLVAYIENNGTSGTLRTALFQVHPATNETAPSLTRARDDVTIALDARSVSLTWDGTSGAITYVAPRVNTAPPAGARRVARSVTVGIPASPADPLGPLSSSGGNVMFVPLNAEGVATGEPRSIFSESSRLWRSAIARESDGWIVAWTGATVTDDEVRGTVRAMRLTSDGTPHRPMASATGFSGDVGDHVRVVSLGEGRAAIAFLGARCTALEGAPGPPVSLNADPSALIDPPTRNPQPQAAVRHVAGPPIGCSPTAVYVSEMRSDDTLGPLLTGPLVRTDALAVTRDAAYVYVTRQGNTVLARVPFEMNHWGTVQSVGDNVAFVPDAPAAVTAVPLENRQRPAPDAEIVLAENVIEPPRIPSPETLVRYLSAPKIVSVVDRTVAEVTQDRRGLVLLTSATPTLLAVSPLMFFDVVTLNAPHPILLTREGTWSGPIRFFSLDVSTAHATELPDIHAAPPPPLRRPPRFETTAPLRYDAEFSRLLAHTRLLRAQFMRHENTAGMMAARPQAPTDPRMPGLIAFRRHLRIRWESSCTPLRQRALVLARAGAGDDVLLAARQVCEIPAELQLGVPIDSSL
jgi:hypothetical protein